jgi:hypothetical protein
MAHKGREHDARTKSQNQHRRATSAGRLQFSVVGQQADSDYIVAMLRRSVKIVCLREVRVDPLAQEKIVRLQVLQVA